MEPEHLRFGGGATETTLTPVVAVLLLIAIVLILTRPREKLIAVFLLSCLCIPIGQVMVLGTLHFPVVRILVIAGLIRRAIERRTLSAGKFPGGFNPIDRMVVLWSVSACVILTLQWMDTGMLIHELGDLLDTLGGYLVFRFLIPDGEAVRRTVKVLAVICVIHGAGMINEQISHVNVFGYLGGTATWVTIRDGQIRSQDVMGCIQAGSFAGALIPPFLWLWTKGKSRLLGAAGLAGATAMVITSHSSTPLLAFCGSFVGLAFWPLRKQMRLVRWGIVGLLVSLHIVMKAPVWALINHIDLTGSSSGYHRFVLMDNCIRHFSDWWLLGYKYYNAWGWDMWDLCNQFVVCALTGGLLTLVCYITVISRSFGALGKARKKVDGDRSQEWLLWALGSALFATVVAHFGINYMTQLMMGFFPVLCCISVASFEASKAVVPRVESPSEAQLAYGAGVASANLPLDAVM